MTKENWIEVFFSQDLIKTKLIEDVLKQNGITSHIVDRPDSAIPSIGAARLYVPAEEAVQAKELIDQMVWE